MRGPVFSPKQRAVLDWWRDGRYDAVICDGAVRSGKTFALSVSFFLWAMARFQRQKFGLCAASIGGVRRNLLAQARPVLTGLGFRWEEVVSRNEVTLRGGGRENTFYLFGGRDEGSFASIQGLTLAGVLLDEAALMPRSFVEQAVARCSVAGSRLWFNCNPEGPQVLCIKIPKKLPPKKCPNLAVRVYNNAINSHAPEGLFVLAAQLGVQLFPAA